MNYFYCKKDIQFKSCVSWLVNRLLKVDKLKRVVTETVVLVINDLRTM